MGELSCKVSSPAVYIHTVWSLKGGEGWKQFSLQVSFFRWKVQLSGRDSDCATAPPHQEDSAEVVRASGKNVQLGGDPRKDPGNTFESCLGKRCLGLPVQAAASATRLLNKRQIMDGWIYIALVYKSFFVVLFLLQIEKKNVGGKSIHICVSCPLKWKHKQAGEYKMSLVEDHRRVTQSWSSALFFWNTQRQQHPLKILV